MGLAETVQMAQSGTTAASAASDDEAEAEEEASQVHEQAAPLYNAQQVRPKYAQGCHTNVGHQLDRMGHPAEGSCILRVLKIPSASV